AFAGNIVVLLVLTFALGLGTAVSQAAEFALLPHLAGSRSIARANGIVESMRGIGFTIGPLIGGVLAAAAGVRGALLIDAASFLAITLALLTIRVRRRAHVEAGVAPRARDGVRLLFAEPVLAVTLMVGIVSLVFMSASIPGDFAYVQNVLGLGSAA